MQDKKLLFKIATAYYKNGLTQKEIADKFGLSRIKISRLLALAQREGIVQIKILEPEEPYADIEQQIEEKFGIDEVIICDEGKSEQETLNNIGKLAANYLIDRLGGHEIIAVSWGTSLNAFVANLPLLNYPELRVVQMIGGLGEPDSPFHGADLVRRMAQAFGAKPRLVHSPGIVRNSGLCLELKEDIQVKETLDLARIADISVVGLGSIDSGLMNDTPLLANTELQELKRLGVIGDISLRFFSRQGKILETPLDDRVVGISAPDMIKIPRKIGIAGGVRKKEVVQAALKANLINVLVTDSELAKELYDN